MYGKNRNFKTNYGGSVAKYKQEFMDLQLNQIVIGKLYFLDYLLNQYFLFVYL